MSEIAGNVRTRRQAAADTPSRRARRFLLQPAALGLLLALLVTVLLGRWFVGQSRDELAAQTQGRMAILEASALAEAVARIVAANPDDTAPLQAALADWVARSPGDDHVLVLRLSGARLLASTRATDLQGELPRRLSREEKWLFDLGQELRAAIDTNVSEGVFRKAQIDVARPAEGRIRVTLPWLQDGAVAGIVQHERPLPGAATGPAPMPWPLLIVLPVAAFWLVALLLQRGVAPTTRSQRWIAAAVALAMFVAAWWYFSNRATDALEATVAASNQAVAEEYRDLRARVPGAEASAEATGGAPNPWDVDVFQRPRKLLLADGSVDPVAGAQVVERMRAPLGRALGGNLLLGVAILAFFALGAARKLRETVSEYRYAYLYVTPAMVGMLILVFFPFAYGITLSFTGQTIFNTNQPLTDLFVGVQNYADILGDFDVARQTAAGWSINYQNFYWTLFITICWTVSNVALGVTLGMILALALNTPGLKGKAIYRVLLILPWAIPNYITALIWKALFHQQFGAVNQAIQMFGGEPVAWFDGVFSSFMTGLATNGWLSFPFMMVVILGGLQSISQDMYEAATVEGATRAQQFWRITLPLLKPTLVPAVILSVVWTFNMFNVIYLVSGGEPAGANEILITKAYKIAFEEYRYAYSAAYSTVIFLILLVYGVFQTRMTRATEAVNA
ncbi:MAG TPA: sugar ABC transporter permease [Steroidobacteraceae bacterium]|nr:sugar ABC transporter permease [Steroidobacteraceae bacterium]